ncbi:hypothetical protein Gogos_002910 [Gossypium gossypioides]|uniref:Anoctamin transmembrane domain-containing protein n=1 Tax=Gossypium gossypioides TaxID=34282 RepID=A0A7J9CKI1_GOSGO|nr:hypothetical protein [Gossypium gossypioides]
MNGVPEDLIVYEIALVVPKRNLNEENKGYDCVEVLVNEFRNVGLIVERVLGLSDEFIKLAAPLETLGRVAAKMQMKKTTHIGVNKKNSDVTLKFDGKKIQWEAGKSLLQRLELEGIVKQVFPLHDEIKRKKLLRSWALNWWDFTAQPIDEIYAYFGTKIAVYFAFLGMYTRWMIFPATFGLILQLIDFGSLKLLVFPAFFISIVLWAVLFFQFWKRKNSALSARWHLNFSVSTSEGYKLSGREWNSLQPPLELVKNSGIDKTKEKEALQRYEWFGYLKRFRNDVIIILSIICLQLPFELAYAHLYEVLKSDMVKFGLTVVYLLVIQYFTKIGGKISIRLIKHENNENTEYQADSLVYKVFGLYFMQSYIGVFYHALLHRNFMTLRQVLIQRLILYEVLENLVENSLPYLKYSYKKYRAVRNKKKREKGLIGKIQFATRVEKEYLKPTYSASISEELEDGLFDDFLELALQFGMIMMFACAFPLAFAFSALNNIAEMRTDALKLLAMLRRPVPRAAATIGAWLNIFQEGKWKIEPGLAAILVMEHVLLLIKFGFSRFVPEEPAWVRAKRMKNATQAQDMCSKQLLRTISGREKAFGGYIRRKKPDGTNKTQSCRNQ